MSERRVADYFVIAGLPENPEFLEDNYMTEGYQKNLQNQIPITDIGVIFPSLDETVPEGFEIITHTPTGLSADLNHGSLRTIECYICYRRGRDKPPLVDIGVIYEGKEQLMADAELVVESVGKHLANVNNSSSKIFITYRRGNTEMPCNALVVTDICVVIASKGESPPHAFCCINKNLNRGIVGSDVFLCYKKSMNRAKSITYKPEILFRYPMKDISNFPFPNSVPLFCLPMGATLEMWPNGITQPKPIFSTFVLTVSDAKYKIYGSSVSFYERFSESKLTEEQKEILGYFNEDDCTLNVIKSICVLSHWPFSEAFKSWLLFLYYSMKNPDPLQIPLEAYITQLIDDVPFPTPRTLLQLNPQITIERVIFTQPEDLPWPRSAVGFKELLVNLGPENCLLVLLLALTEQKILIHSLRPDTLTLVAEAVSSLLFPFKWQCPYIPLCPLGLAEVLHAPLPFLVGVDSRFFDFYDPPPDVSCIDLDTNIVTVAEHQRHILNTKLLPKRPAKWLKALLESLYTKIRETSDIAIQNIDADDIELEFQKRRKQESLECELAEAFLKFMAYILRGYGSYLRPITRAPTIGTTDTEALFRLQDFLKSRERHHQRFYTLLVKTQMFSRFIEERSFAQTEDLDQGLAFFDDCCERCADEGGGRLFEFESTGSNNDKTVFVLPPDAPKDGAFTYNTFQLDLSLMLGKNKKNHLNCSYNQSFLPGSPMARRTNHEIKSAQKFAKKCSRNPESWARCLSGAWHTLYFMTLPSALALAGQTGRESVVLQEAYEVLVRATTLRLRCDEVCYRLMMQLCGEYNKPMLAVKLLVLMRKYGLHPNAYTYGLYNRCVLEAEWPAYSSSSQLWNKLRNVVIGAGHFKRAIKKKSSSNSCASLDAECGTLDVKNRVSSRSSSQETVHSEGLLEKFKRNIFRGNIYGSDRSLPDVVDSNCENYDDKDNDKNDLVITSNGNFKEARMISGSESGGDSSILDIMEKSGRRNCQRQLNYGDGKDTKTASQQLRSKLTATDIDPLRSDHLNDAVLSYEPKFSDTTEPLEVSSKAALRKSATFEGSPPKLSDMHRSNTILSDAVASHFATLGSSFRLGFSATNLTGKKSNELIQGSLSSIKQAASSMVRKFDEIKEAISSSSLSTPTKTPILNKVGLSQYVGNGDLSYMDEADNEERKRKVSGEQEYFKESCVQLGETDEPFPEALFMGKNAKDKDVNANGLSVWLTSCSQCPHCHCPLYDEDIMAHWTADDSNLNTICQSCERPTVPSLTVTVSDAKPFSVPYLNPLVLRKELESLVGREGDACLADLKFPLEHPIVYWNLVWALERVSTPTYLPSLYLRSKIDSSQKITNNNVAEKIAVESNKTSRIQVEVGTDPLTQELAVQEQLSTPVIITCLWDQPGVHRDQLPMYVFWDHTDIPKSTTSKINSRIFMQNIISYIRLNNLSDPMKNLANEREKLMSEVSKDNKIYFSVYRDMLFLVCKALDRSQVDLNIFDREYFQAHSRLTERELKLFHQQDKPMCLNSLYCRQYFKPLSLI